MLVEVVLQARLRDYVVKKVQQLLKGSFVDINVSLFSLRIRMVIINHKFQTNVHYVLYFPT